MTTTSAATTKRSPQPTLGATTNAGAEGAPDVPVTEASACRPRWRSTAVLRPALAPTDRARR